MKFLLEEDSLFDFIFALKKSMEWYNWWQPKAFPPIIELVPGGCERDICPVGSLDFCLGYYKKLGIELKPMNVPESLFSLSIGYVSKIGSGKNKTIQEFLNGIKEYNESRGNEFTQERFCKYEGKWFIKSESIFKYPGNGFYNTLEEFMGSEYYDPSDKYQITRLDKGLLDEWRVFVFDGQVLDMKRYAFEDPVNIHTPEPVIIKKVMEEIKLPAYSFDLGIIDYNYTTTLSPMYKTKLIEVHDFFSTGLYGFQDYSKLPYMFYRSHLHKFL